MYSKKKIARIAGVLYVVLVLTGFFYLRYVPSKLIDRSNPAITVHNIAASETLFRLGILVGLIGYTLFLILPLVLYKLLRSVNKNHAVLMVILAVVSVPISFANMLNNFAVLTLIDNTGHLSAIESAQLQAQVMLNLHYYSNGNLIASIFWGLWLFPLGYLVYRSGFLPKALGVLLMIGCFGYLANFAGELLWPEYSKTNMGTFVTLPASLGELGICLWLLIMGVKEQSQKLDY